MTTTETSTRVNFVSADAHYGEAMARVLEQLAAAIEASPLTRYQLSKITGIGQSQLSRIVSGERGISIEKLEALCDALGIELTLRKKRGSRV